VGRLALRYRDTGRTFMQGVVTPVDKLGTH
jgi:hypothetical protein